MDISDLSPKADPYMPDRSKQTQALCYHCQIRVIVPNPPAHIRPYNEKLRTNIMFKTS